MKRLSRFKRKNEPAMIFMYSYNRLRHVICECNLFGYSHGAQIQHLENGVGDAYNRQRFSRMINKKTEVEGCAVFKTVLKTINTMLTPLWSDSSKRTNSPMLSVLWYLSSVLAVYMSNSPSPVVRDLVVHSSTLFTDARSGLVMGVSTQCTYIGTRPAPWRRW